MSTNYEHNDEDEIRAARRTAHALGQTAGEGRAAVEREMASAPQVREEVEAIASLAARLKEAAHLAPSVEPSAALRAAVEKRLTELESAIRPTPARRKGRPWWRRHMAKLALAAACLLVAAVPVIRRFKVIGPESPREVAQAAMPGPELPRPIPGDARATRSSEPPIIYPDREWWNKVTTHRAEEYADAAKYGLNAVPISSQKPAHGAVPLNSDVVNLDSYSLIGGTNSAYVLQMGVDPGQLNELPPLPLSVDPEESQTGRLMFGVGVDSDAGLVGNVTVDDQNQSAGRALGFGNGPTRLPQLYYNSAKAFGTVEIAGGAIDLTGTPASAALSGTGGFMLSGANAFTGGISTSAGTVQTASGAAGPTTINAGGLAALGTGVSQSGTTLPNGATTTAVISSTGQPGMNFNDTNDPLGKNRQNELDSKLAANAGTAALSLTGTSGTPSGTGLINPVEIESIPGIDVLVIRGNREDTRRVEEIIREVERLDVVGKKQQQVAGTDGDGSPVWKWGDGTEPALKRESIVTDDNQAATSRGRMAVNVSAEYRRELAKMQGDAREITQKLRQGNSLSAAEKRRLDEELRIAKDQIAGFQREVARLEAITEKAGRQPGELGPKEPDKAAAKKPAETWKPARVIPNASRLMVGDKEELPLKGMQVDVRVDGFRARVLLDLYYFNDRPQQLEGSFQLRLPDEASPYFFAFGRTVYQAPQVTPTDSMFFKPQQVFLGDTTPDKILALRGNSWEQPKVARMVPKEKAALAYRDTVRRRIDPALVEWSGAGVFQCRVFPLAPQSLHRVTIGYDVDLVRVGDDLELRLDLPDPAPATVVDLNVAAADARQVSLDSPAAQSPDGRRLSYRLVDPKERPIVCRLRKPGTQMLTGNDEATGDYFATRVALPLGDTGTSDNKKTDQTTLTPAPLPVGEGREQDRLFS